MSSPTDTPPPGTGLELRRATRRAALSRWLSYLAAVIAVIFVGVFLYQAGLYAYLRPALVAPAPHVENPGQITSYDSTMTGKDDAGQPYEVSASRGWQDKDVSHIFHLEAVQATLHRKTGNPYRLTANTAIYDNHARTADVAGAVRIAEDGGFTARMERALIDIGHSTLSSDSAVEVMLREGVIRANGLKITDDGAHILFFNGVKAHFDAAQTPGANP